VNDFPKHLKTKRFLFKAAIWTGLIIFALNQLGFFKEYEKVRDKRIASEKSRGK